MVWWYVLGLLSMCLPWRITSAYRIFPYLPASPRISPHRQLALLRRGPTRQVRLERLLAQFSISGVEIHCFTTAPLTPPAGRPLALESHAKQRALFKHYFDRCTGATRRRKHTKAAHGRSTALSTDRSPAAPPSAPAGIICSTGNETIWEAVCRGVPVLTVPTSGHPEQMMNARIHGRAFPASVRAVSRVRIEDVRWLVDFKPSEESIAESSALRERATTFDAEGARLLCGA